MKEFTKEEKIDYYKSRLIDKRLSYKQRVYADKRLKELDHNYKTHPNVDLLFLTLPLKVMKTPPLPKGYKNHMKKNDPDRYYYQRDFEKNYL